ncbi:hypothetical protein ACFSCX_06315 [Bacillus salitolerans]|uniref:Uncharacterized protein n=1 Tax=Bacillus salitolerans TaxID=1437434 RepID=A0ABW4LMP2_9BACI
MTIAVVDALSIIQLVVIHVLEQYCMIKADIIRVSRMVTYDFVMSYQEEKQMEMELVTETVVESAPVETTQVPEVKRAVLNDDTLQFLSMIEQEVNGPQAEQYEEPMSQDSYIDCMEPDNYVTVSMDDELNQLDMMMEQQPIEDCLTMEDLSEDDENIELDGSYSELATARIRDGLMGEQKWTVQVVGIENEYVHVSDGNRIWLNMGDASSMVGVGEILSVVVNRTEKDITVQHIDAIERTISQDYLIPDEYMAAVC